MMRILQYILGILLLFVIFTVAAFIYLKWWQALIVVFVMIIAMVLGVKYIIRNLGNIMAKSMIKIFEVKSQVLRGADATIHSVQPVPQPPPQEEIDDPDEADAPPENANYYRLDVTITPKPSEGPMHHWDLGDLRLVPFDTPATSLEKMQDEGDIEQYPLDQTEVKTGEHFAADEQGKYEGPQQIRATVAVPPHVRELKFQYYAEQFGHVPLPAPLPSL